MRRYDIVSGILVILSIIDFTLAAPVFAQEKRQAGVDVVHIPKDVIPVLGKRGDEELEKLAAEYFKPLENPIESSDAHASSSATPGPDHGSTNVVEVPAPNPASLTANPDPLMEPSRPSLTAPMQGSDTSLEPTVTPGSSEYGSDHEWTGAHATNPNPNPNPMPSTDPDPDLDGYHLDDPPPPRLASPKENGVAHEYQVHAQQPDPMPSTDPDPDFGWYHPPPRPQENGLAPEYQVGHAQQPDSMPSTDPDPDLDWYHSDDPPPPRPASPKENGLTHDYQVGYVQRPWTDPDPDFDWNRWNWMSLHDPPAPAPAPSPASPEEIGLAPEYQVRPSDQAPSTGPYQRPTGHPDFDRNYWMSFDDPAPLPGTTSPKEIDLATEHLEHVPAEQPNNPEPSNPGPSISAPPGPDHGPTDVVQATAPNPASSTANPGPLVEPPSPSSTAPMQGSWDRFNALWDDLWWYKTGAHVPQPNPNLRPSTELDSDRNLMSAHQPEHETPPPPTPPSPNLGSPKEPEDEVVPGPPSSPDPEFRLDHQSLSADSQPVDLLAAIYAAKGKAKESRRISGTARDVVNAVQRELQPSERSLDTSTGE